ncbi:MAG: hypothetical protein V1747_07835 [Candidatus Omnitrophota bacterium]
MKNPLHNKIICMVCLFIAISNTALPVFALNNPESSRKYCLSPFLRIINSDFQSRFESLNSDLLDNNLNMPGDLKSRALVVGRTSIIFNNKEMSFFELTKSLNLLLANDRFTYFARIEKDMVKYAALSTVEQLLLALKQSELSEYAEQIDIILAILHLSAEDAAIILSGIEPLQQKSITNLTDKAWTNKFRMKRFSLTMGYELDIAKAWYVKTLETEAEERQWWHAMCRNSMPMNMFKGLNADLQKKNHGLIDASI